MTILSSQVVSHAKLLAFLHQQIGIAVAFSRSTCSILNAQPHRARSVARGTSRLSSLRHIGPCVDAVPAATRGRNHGCDRARIVVGATPTNDDRLLPVPFKFAITETREYTLVPHQIVCPKCGTLGLVRVEHIIRGVYASRAYDCGACDFTWTMPDPSPSPVKPAEPRWSSKTRRIGPPKPGRRVP